MKSLLSVSLLSFFLFINVSHSQTYIEEVQALGVISGQGLACGAKRYDTYEMLARAILITKASSNAMQEQGMRVYNEEKANTYVSKQFDGFFDCANIRRRFDSQEIFKTTLYRDGTIKMPDGEIFTPRTPYDVTLLYDESLDSKNKASEIYDSGSSGAKVPLQVKVEGLDTNRTAPSRPSYDTPTAVSNQPKHEATVGRISRQKR